MLCCVYFMLYVLHIFFESHSLRLQKKNYTWLLKYRRALCVNCKHDGLFAFFCFAKMLQSFQKANIKVGQLDSYV